ncbi:amidotransferase 1, exosortase A system-associated [Parahaliea sp. F7430]|uniref:asparagine synthase (glutamine-hydrolyzing) n=1 Tax=Sediminihaliea albiluteola TaxID=2758564 RepID=A0A7W2TVJ2_9GAMM|nr:XrtA/PEP-CTERM system amidotransferase [Sediminihaliea albiluteola]MBA6412705.1 amidotransferase 1, exosortase A system-associated [Sediminihaliea albiluteola]
MCGIAGVFDLRGRAPVDAELLAAMNRVQTHRGPDEDGFFREPGLGLAHRRLSIIDLSSGQQPMSSADGNTCLVYNGEIYNHRELAAELQALGYQFRTRCDTEVILYAWQAWGESCVNRFRGMFAFALYDRRAQSLFLARDRFGIKPLFYSLLADGKLLFGSELKVLKAHSHLPRRLDPQAVEDYFALGYIPEPKTIYRDVHKLCPGHTLLVKRGAAMPAQKQYWDIPFTPIALASEADLREELQQRIREAVKIRMVADVPLGAFLSGGVDSSAVVAMMAQEQQAAVNTCAIGFDVKQYDETSYARLVAERYKTNHSEHSVSSEDFSLLDTLAQLYDEPFADSSALPTYRVCQLARQHVTVALSGDGGDENFAGYRRYRWHMNEERLRSSLPLGLRRAVFAPLGRLYPKADWAPRVFRAKTTLQALARDSVSAYLHSVSLSSSEQRSNMFSPALKSELQGYSVQSVFDHHAARCPSDDPLSMIQYLDMKTYLVGDILTKVDRASMAHSLEVRVPLLDHELSEWVSGLAPDLKLRGQEGKYLLKTSMEPYLPKDVLYRPKMGFGVPLGDWFRGPLKQRLQSDLLEGGLADSGLFNVDYLRRLVSDHQSGRREYSAPLWSLLMFQAATRNDDLGL